RTQYKFSAFAPGSAEVDITRTGNDLIAKSKSKMPDGSLIQDLTYVLAEANRTADMRNNTGKVPTLISHSIDADKENEPQYSSVLKELAAAQRLETAKSVTLLSEESPAEIARVKEAARAAAASVLISGALSLNTADRV